MNALALYRLTSIPEEEKTVRSQPVKKQKLLDTSVESVEYICKSCHSLVHLSSEDTVQCNSCQSRIVGKIPCSKPKSYDAV